VVLRVDRGRPEDVPTALPRTVPAADGRAAEAPDDEVSQLALFAGVGEALPPLAPRLHALAEVADPPLARVTRLSYSAISLFQRCSYRFYAERIAGMRPAPWAPGEGGGGLHATELGDAVHRLLELVDLRSPGPVARWDELAREWYPAAREDEIARIGSLIEAYTTSALARRIASLDGVRPERPFAFDLDGVLLNGRLDVLWRQGERALVLDYKTNALLDRDPAAIVEEEYGGQRTVYALACLRAGAREVEVLYQFLEAPHDVVATTYGDADVPALEAELLQAVSRIRGGDFRPSPSPFACAGCPALDVVCAGPRLADGW
jgi:hypothetical protein